MKKFNIYLGTIKGEECLVIGHDLLPLEQSSTCVAMVSPMEKLSDDDLMNAKLLAMAPMMYEMLKSIAPQVDGIKQVDALVRFIETQESSEDFKTTNKIKGDISHV